MNRLEKDPAVGIDLAFSELQFECELSPSDTNGLAGQIVPIIADPAQKQDLEAKLFSGDLVSNKLTPLLSTGFQVSGDGVSSPSGVKVELGTKANHRRLAVVIGDKPILVVKVTASDGKARSESTDAISDDVFGTFTDKLNLKSQMSTCSFNQLNIIALNSAGANEVSPGVIEVDIPMTLEGNGRYTIKNAVTTAAQNKLGFNLPGPYQQVMYVLEGCYQDYGWAAYAYVNSWLSVYQGDYFKFVGVQMHGNLTFTLPSLFSNSVIFLVILTAALSFLRNRS